MSVNFKTVPWIESGLGKISLLYQICIKLNIKRPIIVTDKGLYKIGYLDRIIEILKKKNIQSTVYKDVLADPPEYNIFEAVELFHEFDADGVIGLGGGSSMDVAKAVSYFSMNKIPI